MALRTFHPVHLASKIRTCGLATTPFRAASRCRGMRTLSAPMAAAIGWPITPILVLVAAPKRLNKTLAWRALNSGMLGGSVAINVDFCDRLHQPVGDLALVPHSDGTPFSDDSLYQSSGRNARSLLSSTGKPADRVRQSSTSALSANARCLVASERPMKAATAGVIAHCRFTTSRIVAVA